ncbi:sensor histidine kinase [Streptomyces sp. NPDC088785]|uniref:sensor histidine kinase n=1 Tax=Streptomyces sp. NPDC088785 TaxID=3365897 RepID=UPI003826482B
MTAVALAVLVTAVLALVLDVVAAHELRSQADGRLRGTIAAVASAVDVAGTRVVVRESAHDAALDSPVWVYDRSKAVEAPPVGRRPAVARTALRLAASAAPACATVGDGDGDGDGGPEWRMCAGSVSPRGRGVAVVAALDLAPYDGSARLLSAWSVVFAVATLACACVLARSSVARALRPVATMTERAARWTVVSPSTRFAVPGAPEELLRLGSALDSLLDRVRGTLRHERLLTAELAHELRTPLTRIVAELELWQARPRDDAETRRARTAIAEAAAGMRVICDTLLAEARDGAATDGAPHGTSDVSAVLHRVADAGRAGGRRTVVRVEAGLRAGVADAVLERIVSPLYANALRHARSAITLEARATPEGVRCAVSDDGPGVPARFVPYLFQPGRRAEPADGHDGAGLGLSLVLRLARSAGGTARYEEGRGGGARFVVDLPG